jgi:hypothetical protein
VEASDGRIGEDVEGGGGEVEVSETGASSASVSNPNGDFAPIN